MKSKINFKRFILVLLSVSLISVSVLACGKNDQTGGNDTTASKKARVTRFAGTRTSETLPPETLPTETLPTETVPVITITRTATEPSETAAPSKSKKIVIATVEPSKPTETTAPTKPPTAPQPTETTSDNGLLKAESFTMDDILANGPLYPRRDQFDPKFIEDALAYFPQIAGGNEFDPTIEHVIRKWDINNPMSIRLYAEYNDEDLAVINRVIPVISTLTGMTIQFVEDDSYTTRWIFDKYENLFNWIEGYVENNWGLVMTWWDGNNTIYKTDIGISIDLPNRRERSHLIQEEFIQSFGLPNDSYQYPDSIFQQNWTDVQEPMPIDWLLMEMLYRPEIKPGMTMEECDSILRALYLN